MSDAPSHAALSALRARVDAATGPDREIDCAIFVATAPSPFVSYYPDCVLATLGGFAARVEIEDIPRYTSSIDAALELVEAKLPGRDWDVGSHDEGTVYGACVAGELRRTESTPYGPAELYRESIVGRAATPALALLSALLSALMEQSHD